MYQQPTSEDVALGQRGDRAAQARVIANCSKLIDTELFRARLSNDDDARQECAIALLVRALRCYDATRGVPFGVYARFCLRSCLREHRLRNLSLLKVPSGSMARKDMARMFAGDVSNDRTAALQAAYRGRVDLDGWHGLEATTPPTAEDDVIARQRVAMVAGAAAGLTPREKEVFKGRWHGAALEQIGDDLGISRQRVSELERSALGKIRRKINP
jgi:RNA polymerase sigma factor (sigma-70 family)